MLIFQNFFLESRIWFPGNLTEYLSSANTDSKKKVKEVDLYSAFIVVPHTQGAQVRITQCYLQITQNLLPASIS